MATLLPFLLNIINVNIAKMFMFIGLVIKISLKRTFFRKTEVDIFHHFYAFLEFITPFFIKLRKLLLNRLTCHLNLEKLGP